MVTTLFERDEKSSVRSFSFSFKDVQGKVLFFCLLLGFCRGTIVRLGERLPGRDLVANIGNINKENQLCRLSRELTEPTDNTVRCGMR